MLFVDRRQQRVHKGQSIVVKTGAFQFADARAGCVAEPKDLLELVDHNQHVARGHPRHAVDRIDESVRTRAQTSFHLTGIDFIQTVNDIFPGRVGLCSLERRRGQFGSQVAVRASARTGDHMHPILVCLTNTEPRVGQFGQQTGFDQRRLTAAAGTDHGQEMLPLQNVEHADELTTSSEEDRLLIRPEWTQSGIRAWWKIECVRSTSLRGVHQASPPFEMRSASF